jgi:catechol 2,3-dioxygenase-like lactoylglutathione lyase family enzyme
MQQSTVVRNLVGLLCTAAAVLIAIIASGSEIDETGGKAILTATALAFFSLTVVAGSNLKSRRPDLGGVGYLTVAISAIALLIVIATTWIGDFSDDEWRPAAYLAILAFALGQASVLLASAQPAEPEAVRAARAGALIALAVLVAMVFVEIAEPGSAVGAQAIAVVAVLYVLGVVLIPLLRRSAGATTPSTGPVAAAPATIRLDHVVISVSDWERSNAFYRDVLGAEVLTLPGGRTAYRFGAQQLTAHGPGTDASPRSADPVRPGNSDLCFVWPGDAEAAGAHLRERGVPVLPGPVERQGAAGPGRSVYCRDPDGSLIELISYE